MNTKTLVIRSVVIFVALAVAGTSMVVCSKFVLNGLDQIILVVLGSAIFGAALSFFLVRLLSLVEK